MNLLARLTAAMAVVCLPGLAAAGGPFSIGNYTLVNTQPVSRTVSQYTYRATLTNGGPAITGATATVVSSSPGTVIVSNSLTFGAAAASGQVVSSNTFVINQDRTYTFDASALQWTVNATLAAQKPTANAGQNQSVNAGTQVTLNGTGSTDPLGLTLTYSWSFVTRPASSAAALSNAAIPNPTFRADKPGTYQLQLIVSNGTLTSDPATVTISTQAVPPTANAGSAQTVSGGATVHLDGSASSDPAGLPLTYSWSLTSRPTGSNATLSGASGVQPTFVVDRAGAYVARLIVNNGYFDSTSSLVTITTLNSAPVANAGANQRVNVGTSVLLDGSASTDVNGDPLTYKWSLITRPATSLAALNNPNAVMPSFQADRPGIFVAQLIVNDGTVDSAPATVTITTDDIAPTANAGANQTFTAGKPVTLDGSQSISHSGLPLTYSWSWVSRPAGSTAAFSSTTVVNPTFTPDALGAYVAQLIVSDGILSSQPSTVTITSNSVAPTANAGPNQSAPVGALVTLDGSASTDLDGHLLTYSWSLTKPAGSNATLSSTTAVKPTFTIDVFGTYVAQLIVNDGYLNSAPSTVTISTQTLPPVARPGADQLVSVGALVSLDGSASSDPNGLPLEYTWSFNSKPAQSNTVLQNANTANPSFTADKGGTYIVQLIVKDSEATSVAATVTISTNNIKPVANPGSNQNVTTGDTVTLDGSASTGTSGYSLTYHWSLITRPDGSTAALAGASTVSPTFVADLPGAYVAQLIVHDGIQNSLPKTVTITAAAAQTITVSLDASSSLTYGTVNGTIHLSVPAGPGGLTVNLHSSANSTASVPSSVLVPQNTQDAVFTATAGTTAGTVQISVSGSGFNPGAPASLAVTNRTGSVVLNSSTIAAGRSIGGMVLLNDPAPAPSITFGISAANPAILSSSTSVNIGAAQTTGNFTITGGTTTAASTVNANAAGFTITGASLTNTASLITLASGVNVGAGQSANLGLTLSQPAPQGGLTVSLSASPAGIVSVPATVFIAEGTTSPATAVVVQGVSMGGAQVTASAPNWAPDTQNITVNVSMNFSQVSLPVLTDNTADLTLTISAPAGPSGLLVNLQIDDTNKATVPAIVQVPAGSTSVTVTVRGVATGTTTLRATASGATPANATIVVSQAPSLTMSTAIIGKDLQVGTNVTLGAVAPAGNATITVQSSNPAALLLSNTANGAGSASIQVSAAAGGTLTAAFYVQALQSSGSAQVTLSAPGYANGTQTFTFTPSGMVIATNAGVGVGISTTPGADITIEVRPYRLAADNSASTQQALRGGLGPIAISVANSTPTTGTLGSFTLNPGANAAPATFHALVGGTTSLTLTQPAGFTTPTTGQSANVTVNSITFNVQNVSVGKDLQAGMAIYLSANAPENVTFTIASDNPNLLLTHDAAVLGSQTVTRNVNKGSNGNTTMYVQALAATGTATITVSAPGYPTATGTVTLTPSGFALSPASGVSSRSFTATSLGSNVTLWVQPARLNAAGVYQSLETLRAGAGPFTINLTSQDTSIGTVPASITIGGGQSSVTTNFTPGASGGTVNVSIAQPSGFVAGTYSSNALDQLTGTVTAPTMTLSAGPVGKDLQRSISAYLNTNAPAGGVVMTVTSDNPNLLLSRSAAVLGTQSVTTNVPQNQNGNSSLYAQALADSGVANLTITAPGYTTKSVAVQLTPSGFYMTGNGGRSFTTDTFSSRSISVSSSVVGTDGTRIGDLNVRPGVSITVPIAVTDTNVGTLSAASVTFGANDATKTINFFPAANGTTTIVLTEPAGYLVVNPGSAPWNVVTATVNAPTITLGSATVGKDLQTTIGAFLDTAAPAGGVTMTITSNNPSVLLSRDPNVLGSQTLTTVISAGSTGSATLYVQSLAGAGTATLTASAPQYTTKTSTVTLTPSGFVLLGYGTSFNTTVGAKTSPTMYPSQLDPSSGIHQNAQRLRPGVSAVVNVNSTNTTVGTVSPSTFTFDSTVTNGLGVTFSALAKGTTVLNVAQPAGFSTPASYGAITVNVN